MDTNSTYTYLFLMIGAIVLITYITWCFLHSRSLLHHWASTNELHILNSGLTSSGPLSWTSSRSQIIYYVKVRDKEGQERRGWVRCGSFWMGVFSSKTEVRWDCEEKPRDAARKPTGT
jgi:hypothetical protein